MLHRMNSLEDTVLTTANFGDGPAWSPDSASIIFQGDIMRGEGLMRVSASTGLTDVFAPLSGPTRGCSWSPAGTIAVTVLREASKRFDLLLLPASGGAYVPLKMPSLPAGSYYWPEFLPDGKNLLFAHDDQGAGGLGLYLATLEGGRITRGPVLLLRNTTAGHYSPAGGGQLLYVRDDDLYARRLNISRGTLEGEPAKIVHGVYSEPWEHDAGFSVSRNGVLAWHSGRSDLAQATSFDRNGRVLGTTGPPCFPALLRLSPDQKRVLLQTVSGFGTAELDQGGFVPLSDMPGDPLWNMRDGHIVFTRNDAGGMRVVDRAPEGGPETELRLVREQSAGRVDLSRDGRFLLYRNAKLQLYALELDDPHSAPQSVAGFPARFSPDGRWVAYQQDGFLYVRPFPGGGLPIQISPSLTGVGGFVWRGDGQEILYLDRGAIYSIPVRINGRSLDAGKPQALFGVRAPAHTSDSEMLDVTRDGSRILFLQRVEQPNPQLTYVMTNWESRLRR